jgi:cell division cycle 20-like protein 1 (cofactor of APC complex)
MDAEYERRLLLSMNGQNSLSSYTSPIQSPIKTSDRYIPLRSSLSTSSLHYQLPTSPISASPRKAQCSSTSTSPSKKYKYEPSAIGLSTGITGSEPDLAVYEQLLQNTLLNTNIDSILKISDTQNTSPDNVKTVTTPKKPTISKENCSLFRYSERREDLSCQSGRITKQHFSRSPISNASIRLLYSPKKSIRHIPELPYKVLDAPDLQDDFYLNLLDWSPSNILSVALGPCVYLHNAQTNSVQLLCDLTHTSLPVPSNNQVNIIGSDVVTSVHWSDWSNVLAVGKKSIIFVTQYLECVA